MKKPKRFSIALLTTAAITAGSISPAQAQIANQSSTPLVTVDSFVQDAQNQIDRTVADAIKSLIAAFPQAAPVLNPILNNISLQVPDTTSPAPTGTVRASNQDIINAVNASRAEFGGEQYGNPAPLTVDAGLNATAQAEAEALANRGEIVTMGNSLAGGDSALYFHTYVAGQTPNDDAYDPTNFHKEPFIKKVQAGSLSDRYILATYQRIGVGQVEKDGRIYTVLAIAA